MNTLALKLNAKYVEGIQNESVFTSPLLLGESDGAYLFLFLANVHHYSLHPLDLSFLQRQLFLSNINFSIFTSSTKDKIARNFEQNY